MSISGPSSASDSETFGQDVSFHLEQPVGSMTISPSGRDVALASREGLHVIDLDSPYSAPRYLPHRTPWEVADVQWSPFASRDYWVVSTSNQKALVWNLAAKSWQDTIEFVLHGHTRAITDINFSAFNPDILATCAVDSFVHCWDLRIPLRPAFSFSDWFAAATQVKWSRQDEHVVASSHDKFLHVWDNRNGATPVRTIEAHDTKIYGIDWNRFHTNKIVTCSLDRRIKFWDTTNLEDKPERIIETPFPVWRARHTPFGWGMMAMPQRGSGDLFLYDRRPIDGHLESGHARPVAKFQGHTGQVKEFLWRARGTAIDGIDQRDFQLISWGTDKELRLHRLDPNALESIGYEKGISKTHQLRFTRRGARYRTFRDLPDDTYSPIEPVARGESFPSQGGLQFRKRASTNVGMSKVPAAQIRGWVAGNRRSSRVAMHGKGQNHNEINPISWLKNVRIATWDPDTLAEEIRHVGDKFKKVEFETVDIRHRKLVMSLQAPWSEHQNAIYLRIDTRFPQTYPRGANAIINVQKTSAVDDNLRSTLSIELQKIAEVYASQRRGCLEAMLRYLLREQSLEEIVTWVMGESVVDSKLIEPDIAPGEDSSDSDDDNLEGMGKAVASAANVRVPLAKGCGALWSEGGKLVCFFPPKRVEPESILGALSVQNLEGSDSSRLFEGFGRLRAESPSRKATNGTVTGYDASDTDSSDSYLGSSSSSSSTSSGPTTELRGATLPHSKHIGQLRQHPHSIDPSNQSTTLAGARLLEASRQTYLSIHDYDDLLPAKRNLAENYQIVARGPEVCRHNAEVARATGRFDLSSVWTLASMILERTVPLHVAKSPIDDSDTSILFIARQASSGLRRKDRGPEQDSGRHEMRNDMRLFGQLRWGASPLASKYLITAMFDYYERLADVQMLAMLSCVFAKASFDGQHSAASTATATIKADTKSTSLDQYYPSSMVAESILQPAGEANGFVLVSQPGTARMPQMLSSSDDQAHYGRRSTFALDPTAMNHRSDRGNRPWSRAASVSEEAFQPSSRSAGASLSTSPEGNRHIHRASTSGMLTEAQASLSALTQSFSHSPPGQSTAAALASSLKKYSPSGSSLAPGWGVFSSGHGSKSSKTSIHYAESSSQDKAVGLRSSASYSNVRHLRQDGRLTPDASHVKSSVAPSEASASTKPNSPAPRKAKVFKKRLRNQDKFDIESHAALSLLDPNLEWKYRAYRANYMQLLEVWRLHSQLAEMRKIDGMSFEDDTSPSPRKRLRRKTLTSDFAIDNHGLQIRRCCQDCGDMLAAIEKNGIAIGWHCVNTVCATSAKKISKKTSCSLCWKTVSALSTPCLQCGHLLCHECSRLWFEPEIASIDDEKQHERRSSSKSTIVSADSVLTTAPAVDEDAEAESSRDNMPTCPTGCGCPCAALKSINIPMPAHREDDEVPVHRQPLQRTISQLSTTSEAPTMTSLATTDTALNAFMALTRSASVSQASGVGMKTEPVVDISPPKIAQELPEVEGHNVDEEERLLNPWAGSKLASLGRGMGGGLSRGLREKGSDSTIRKMK